MASSSTAEGFALVLDWRQLIAVGPFLTNASKEASHGKKYKKNASKGAVDQNRTSLQVIMENF